LEKGRCVNMGSYLTIAKTVRAEKHSAGKFTRSSAEGTGAYDKKQGYRRDKSDISDRSWILGGKVEPVRHAALTVGEALGEINTPDTGAAIQATCYLRGEIAKENAIRWITCAVMHRWGESFEGWKRHAPAVEVTLIQLMDCDQCL
jgi:hypothetical protein